MGVQRPYGEWDEHSQRWRDICCWILGRIKVTILRRALAPAAYALVLALGSLYPAAAQATSTLGLEDYLLIGTGTSVEIGTTVASSNFELGQNNEVVPMSGLAGSVPALPANALPVVTGITNDGDVAILHEGGVFNFSNMDIRAVHGVDCRNGGCLQGLSNSLFNGTPMKPSAAALFVDGVKALKERGGGRGWT